MNMKWFHANKITPEIGSPLICRIAYKDEIAFTEGNYSGSDSEIKWDLHDPNGVHLEPWVKGTIEEDINARWEVTHWCYIEDLDNHIRE